MTVRKLISTVLMTISLVAVICSAAVSIYRNSQPIPPPIYKEYGGAWRQTGMVSTRPDDLTVCEVARRESQRLKKTITIDDVEAAIIAGKMHPEPNKIEATRVTFRISPSYYIEW